MLKAEPLPAEKWSVKESARYDLLWDGMGGEPDLADPKVYRPARSLPTMLFP